MTAGKAVKRTCADALFAGRKGVEVRRVRAADSGLVQARLIRAGRSDWDLAVFDSRGRLVAASAHWATRELAEGVVTKGDRLTVQACRRSGGGKRARLSVSTVAAAPTRGKIQLVRVSTPTRADKTRLVESGLDVTEHGRETYLDVVLHGTKDVATLRKAGFSYRVLFGDLVALDRKQRKIERDWAETRRGGGARKSDAPGDGVLDGDAARAPLMPSGRLTYRHFWDYAADMKALVEQHPEFVKPLTLNHLSLEGRPVEGIEIANDVHASDGRPVFLQMGLHHSREWPSGEMPMEWAFELVKGLEDGNTEITRLLSEARVILVPVVNPDGFNLSREASVDAQQSRVSPSLAYKRKNCRIPLDPKTGQPMFSSCATGPANMGVDPNRNYGGLWGGAGASGTWNAETYWGTGPFSEPETQNVRELVSTRQVTTLITNHTYSDLILRPPGVKAQGKPYDEEVYETLGADMAAQNGYTNQPSYELYDTTGTTEDWTYPATGGLGFTFEIGKGEGVALTGAGFHPAFPVGVPAEYYGKGQYFGKGNREAYFIALRNAADPEMHSVITGDARPGATLRLSKSFITETSPRPENGGEPIQFEDNLVTTMSVGDGREFEWHVNPSTRPHIAKGVPGREVTGPPNEPMSFSHELTEPFLPGTGQLVQDLAHDFAPAEAKPFLRDAAPGTYEDREFTIGPNNGSMTVRVEWPNHWMVEGELPNDMDLRVYRKDEGSWDQVASSTTDNSGGPSETAVVNNPWDGDYKIRVENWLSAERNWTASVTFTEGSSDPGVPPATESWTLECIVRGRVRASRQVTIARGEQLDVGDACKKEKPQKTK